VDLSLQISPAGDTTAREISAASQEVREVLERLPGVERIGPHRVLAPDQTKGGWSTYSAGSRSPSPPLCSRRCCRHCKPSSRVSRRRRKC
jgi:hypothetical protein